MGKCTDYLFRHPVLNFVALGAFFMLFGFTSVDLFVLLKANITLFVEHGAAVIEEGALRQLIELLATALLCILLFACFAVCERVLVRRLMARWMASRAL